MNIFGNAAWIWPHAYDTVNTYVSFADEFDAPVIPASGIMYLAADSDYALYLNETLVAFGQYADYAFDPVYDAVDITPFLHPGRNTLRVDCYHQGDDSSTHRGESAGLIYRAVLDGRTAAESSCMTRAALMTEYDSGHAVEHVSGQLGYTFRCDMRRGTRQWHTADQTTSRPIPARVRPIRKLTVGDNAAAHLTVHGVFDEACSGDNVTIGQRMQYALLAWRGPREHLPLPSDRGVLLEGSEEHDGVYALIDTGCEHAGIVSLDIDLPCDAEILIGWGEHVEDLRVRAYVGGRNFCASYYGKKGRNQFLHPFRRLGMRYLQLHIYAPQARIHYAGIRATDYPVTAPVGFRCADHLHNRIYEVSCRTLQLCMHEHYEDCPWREQALYSMDSRNQMLCGYYAFREYAFARASLRLMAQSVRADGMLELCSPARVGITIPSFTAVFLTQVFEYLCYAQDADFVRELLPTLHRIAGAFLSRIDRNTGLIPCYQESCYWNFYEWQDGLSGSIAGSIADDDVTYDAPLNAFVALGLYALSETLVRLGLEDSEGYLTAAAGLYRAVQRVFWQEEKGCYATYLNRKNQTLTHDCELTNALVLYASDRLFSGDDGYLNRRRKAAASLQSGCLLPVTLSYSIFKYDVLMEEPDAAGKRIVIRDHARYVFDDVAEKWGHMLYRGATSFWETIRGDADFDRAGSLCHGWSAVPAYLYLRYGLALPGEATGLYECRSFPVLESDGGECSPMPTNI